MKSTPARIISMSAEVRREEYIRDAPDEDFACYTARDIKEMLGCSYEHAYKILRSLDYTEIGEKRYVVRKPIFRRWMMERQNKGQRG